MTGRQLVFLNKNMNFRVDREYYPLPQNTRCSKNKKNEHLAYITLSKQSDTLNSRLAMYFPFLRRVCMLK
jgi:hypothetical protein